MTYTFKPWAPGVFGKIGDYLLELQKRFDPTAGHTHAGTAGEGPEIAKLTALTTPLTSTSWDGDAYSTTAATLIDLSAVFGVPANVKAVAAQIICRDSAVWGTGSLRVAIGPSAAWPSALEVYTFGGDLWANGAAVVPCDTNGDVYYVIAASGAGTMDVYIRVYGYWL